MRSVKCLGLGLILLLLTSHCLAGEIDPLLKFENSLGTKTIRGMYSDWSVYVDSETVYFPMDDGLPNPFTFDDLIPGMAALSHGDVHGGSNSMDARTVMVFISLNSAAMHRNSPPPGGDSLYGEVSFTDPGQSVFGLWVNQHQGEMMDVKVLPCSQYWEALQGCPRVPLNSIFEFCPGDPIMIHGYEAHDLYRGSVFVKSDDWFPSEYTIGPTQIMEVYGWVDSIFYGYYGSLFVSVLVDTVTGDPNHQTFTKTVGPEGGYVHFPWGHLDFPPGALNASTDIVVNGDFMFWWTLQNTYEFFPSMEFSVPVEMEIRYFNLDQIDPDRVKLVFYNENSERWELACHMVHYPDEHCFRGLIDHFSRYSLSTNNRPLQGTTLQPN